MPGMMSQLHFTPIQTPLIDIKGTVFLAQVIKRFAIGTPYRRTVFSFEIGQPGIGAFSVIQAAHPYITGNGRSVVLTPIVFISFLVVIQ